MNAELFAREWCKTGDKLEFFNKDIINELNISQEIKEFLAIGLPAEAAPFLSFGKSAGAKLQSASSEFRLASNYSKFIIIGFNSYGDPICIDASNESIVYLNHDDEFGFVFMNSSISDLVQFLLLFRDFITRINNIKSGESQKQIVKDYIKKFKNVSSKDFKNGRWDKELLAVIE